MIKETKRGEPEMGASKRYLLVTAAFGAWSLAATSPLFAQNDATPPAPAPAAPVAEPSAPPPAVAPERDIIVTATRRAERLENVPASVLAVSGPALQTAGVTNIHDLSIVAPGVQISNFGIYSQPAIRGVSTTFAQLAQETNVALYVDGFYNADQLSTNMDLSGLQDVQILKGPQGTLYGRNATGGAILLTTRSPTNKWQIEGDIKYKPRFNDRSAGTFIGGPIAPGVKISLSAYWRKMDGYVHDINNFSPNVPIENRVWNFGGHARPLNWTDVLVHRRVGDNTDHYLNWYIRPKLVLEPTDDLKITLGYNRMYINEPRTFNFTWNDSILNKSPTYNGFAVTQQNDKSSLNWRPDGITKTSEVTSLVEWHLGDIGTLTNRFAYRRQKDIQVYDIDGTPCDATTARVPPGNVPACSGNDNDGINLRRTWVEQLDYSGKFGNLDLLSGFFYYHDNAYNKWGYSDTGNAHGPQAQYQAYLTRAWALYVDGTYNLHDKLFITAGVRYAHDERSANAWRYYGDGFLLNTDFPECYVNNGLIPGVPTTAQATLSPLCTGAHTIKAKKNVFTPRFVLRYNLSPGTNIWASVTRGFKATALNLTSPFNTLKPETVWAYEAGIKTAQGPFRAEGSFFYYDYKENQLNGFNSNLPQVATIALNAGGATIYGIDGSVSYRFPGDRFNLHANFEWLHARYTNIPEGSNTTIDTKGTATTADYTVATVFANWSGRRMVRAPDFSGSVSADYTANLFDGKLVASATASFSSRYAPTNASYQCSFHRAVDPNNPGPGGIPAGQGPGERAGQLYCDKQTNHKKRGLFEENGYLVINASLMWTDPTDHWTIGAFIDNLTDNRYYFLARGTAFGNSYRITAPRSAGIRVGFKY
jgi:iron complex outermembrane receptor protein